MRGSAESAAVGLYVHVPVCPCTCGYCDFYSVVPRAGEVEALVGALLSELESAVGGGVRIETMFVGGGTPTFPAAADLCGLFDRLGRLARAHGVSEFSVDTNPGTLDDAKAGLLVGAGVNRISLGVQSFIEAELGVLGRVHGPADIERTAGVIRRAGFAHFNVDLMFGIPGQTRASWVETLGRAIELGPDHLACYGLTYEPGTPLHGRREAGEVEPMAEALEADLYTETAEHVKRAGFEQYEISNYARPGGRCRHNLRYWHNEATRGIGPAAASYVGGRRWRNVPDTAEYVRRVRSGEDLAVESEVLEPARRAGETAMLMLRLVEGISCERFEALTGFDPRELFGEALMRHQAAGLVASHGDRIALTRAGRLVADTVLADFVDARGGRSASSRG